MPLFDYLFRISGSRGRGYHPVISRLIHHHALNQTPRAVLRGLGVNGDLLHFDPTPLLLPRFSLSVVFSLSDFTVQSIIDTCRW